MQSTDLTYLGTKHIFSQIKACKASSPSSSSNEHCLSTSIAILFSYFLENNINNNSIDKKIFKKSNNLIQNGFIWLVDRNFDSIINFYKDLSDYKSL